MQVETSEKMDTDAWVPSIGETVIRGDWTLTGGVEAIVISIKDGEVWLKLKAENNVVIEPISQLRPLNKIDSFDYNAFFREAESMSIKDRNTAAEVFTSRTSQFRDQQLPHCPEAAIKLWKMNIRDTQGEQGCGEYGGYLYELGCIKEAVEIFKLGADINPNTAFGAAVSLEQLGRYEEAFMYYKKAINLQDRIQWQQYSKFNAMNTLAEFYLLGLGCSCDENEAMSCAYLVYEYARTCLREEYRDKFYVTYAYFLHHNIGRDPNPDKDKVDFWQLYSQGDRLHMPLLMQGLESIRLALDPYRADVSPLTQQSPASTVYFDAVLDRVRTTFDDYHWTSLVEYNRRNLHRSECQELMIYCHAYGILQQPQDVASLLKLLDGIDYKRTSRLIRSWKEFVAVRRKFCCVVKKVKVPAAIIEIIIAFELWICPKLT